MHISDGVLSPYIVGIGWAVALPTLAISVRRLRTEQVGAYGVVAAAFFACSTIHVPVGPFSMHLVLSGIAGLLLGWGALTVVTVGLLLQALFIGFGGLTVLGVNISIMALSGAIMLASYDLSLIAELKKRCIFMDNGKLVADKPTFELVHDKRTLEQYGMESIEI